ncbi:unnamed protein product [Polarella glacialis]|uniref:Neurotransmitter-gated ion-channel ligand-binding domain-containing protein n=1 Tax=Polarella glacialis TaxID=89957 RepID=A0A813K881_POLGL|nr:unnamed protein product [Polarella glacialis]
MPRPRGLDGSCPCEEIIESRWLEITESRGIIPCEEKIPETPARRLVTNPGHRQVKNPENNSNNNKNNNNNNQTAATAKPQAGRSPSNLDSESTEEPTPVPTPVKEGSEGKATSTNEFVSWVFSPTSPEQEEEQATDDVEAQAQSTEALRRLTEKARAKLELLARSPALQNKEQPEDEIPAREITTSVVVPRIFNINTLEQHFSAQVNITMVWPLPVNESESAPEPANDDGDWIPVWTPKYRFRHLLEEKYGFAHYSTRWQGGQRWIVAESEHLVVISEALELGDFPVDCQDLNLQILSLIPTTWAVWKEPEDSELIQLDMHHCLLNDFDFVKECPFTFRLYASEHEARTASRIDVKIKLARKSFYYILNVAGMVFIIASFSVASFAIHPAAIKERLATDFQLVLTCVTLKLLLGQMLPPLSYITLLDFYVISGFMFVAGMTVTHTIVPMWYVSKKDVSAVTLSPLSFLEEAAFVNDDGSNFRVCISCWMAFNVMFVLYAKRKAHSVYSKFVAEALAEQKFHDTASDEEVSKRYKSQTGL